MIKTQIVTDTGADLTNTMLNGRTIEVLPMDIDIDGKIRKSSLEIDLFQMYQDMRNKSVYKTSQVSLDAFLSCFDKYAAQGIPVLYIGLSSGLSGTISTAYLAADEIKQKYPNAEIYIVDSKCATVGYGRSVVDAYDMVEENIPIEEIVQKIEYETAHTEHLFTVSTLEYLVRGGRLSAASAAIAGTLQIKPILNINEQGKLVAKEKIRGDKKIKQRMADLLLELSQGLEDQTLYILHGDDETAADELINVILQKMRPAKIIKEMVGCTIGAHSGPGTLGIVFTNPNK